jgi:hypothetical protein
MLYGCHRRDTIRRFGAEQGLEDRPGAGNAQHLEVAAKWIRRIGVVTYRLVVAVRPDPANGPR